MIIILMGKSASGKDTLLKNLIKKLKYNPLVSHTTREPRKGEKNGVEYNFIKENTYKTKDKKKEFISKRISTLEDKNIYYGLSKSEIVKKSKKGVVILDQNGAKQLKEYCKKIETITVYLETSEEVRLQRALKRGDKEEAVKARFLEDDEDFKELIGVDFIIDSSGTEDETLENFKQNLKLYNLIKENDTLFADLISLETRYGKEERFEKIINSDFKKIIKKIKKEFKNEVE